MTRKNKRNKKANPYAVKRKRDKKVEQLVAWTASEFMRLLKGDPDVYFRMFKPNEEVLKAHRNEVLKSLHGKVVKCEATLAQRGIGTRKNLNLVVNISIEDELIDHMNIYDEFIDSLDVPMFGTFKFEARVYGYQGQHGESYSIKPKWMPINKNRNEF